MPTKREGLPGTLERSPREAQRTHAETLDSADELLQRARAGSASRGARR